MPRDRIIAIKLDARVSTLPPWGCAERIATTQRRGLPRVPVLRRHGPSRTAARVPQTNGRPYSFSVCPSAFRCSESAGVGRRKPSLMGSDVDSGQYVLRVCDAPWTQALHTQRPQAIRLRSLRYFWQAFTIGLRQKGSIPPQSPQTKSPLDLRDLAGAWERTFVPRSVA